MKMKTGSAARARGEKSPSAVIYTRVSSDAQVDGTSLGTQLDACRACAARLGLAVLSEHEDAGKSARSTVGRDALAAAEARCGCCSAEADASPLRPENAASNPRPEVLP
jgi:hypothetical protein